MTGEEPGVYEHSISQKLSASFHNTLYEIWKIETADNSNTATITMWPFSVAFPNEVVLFKHALLHYLYNIDKHLFSFIWSHNHQMTLTVLIHMPWIELNKNRKKAGEYGVI